MGQRSRPTPTSPASVFPLRPTKHGPSTSAAGPPGPTPGYAVLAVALVAFVIALAASNTAHVKVNWVFGSSRVSLVWLVLFAAIVGWLLGLAATATFHWRTRAPRRRGGETS